MAFTFPELKKPTKQQVRKALHYIMIVLVGNMITAAGSAFFIIPNGFIMGGSTGIGIFVRNILELYGNLSADWQERMVSLTVYAVNIGLFLVGALLLGKKFAAATLAGTILYPSFLSLFTLLNDLYMTQFGLPLNGEDRTLGAIYGALLFGLGIAVVVRVGASTGGTDIPPLILNKFFGTPIALTLWVLDMAIILLQFFAQKPLEEVLLGVMIALGSSVVVDVVSPIGMRKTQVKIVSKKYREIRDMILDKLNRGVTVLYGQTGYLKEKCFVLLTIVGNRELHKLKNEVQRIDPEAFMTISVVSEVRGRGFTSEGIRLPKEAEGKDDLIEVPPEALSREQDGQNTGS